MLLTCSLLIGILAYFRPFSQWSRQQLFVRPKRQGCICTLTKSIILFSLTPTFSCAFQCDSSSSTLLHCDFDNANTTVSKIYGVCTTVSKIYSGLLLIGSRAANMSKRNVGEWIACLTWLYELLVRTLISRTNAYAGCGRPTLNFIEHFDMGLSVPTLRSHFTVCQSGASIVCIQIMLNCLAWMWT